MSDLSSLADRVHAKLLSAGGKHYSKVQLADTIGISIYRLDKLLIAHGQELFYYSYIDGGIRYTLKRDYTSSDKDLGPKAPTKTRFTAKSMKLLDGTLDIVALNSLIGERSRAEFLALAEMFKSAADHVVDRATLQQSVKQDLTP